MLLSRLARPFRVTTLVYQFPVARKLAAEIALPSGFSWQDATEPSIQSLFASDRGRRHRFVRFLRSGCFGSFLVSERQWVTYGWCAPPGAALPPHLPRWCAELDAWWIFYCHTRPEFRGRGNHQRILARLIAPALSHCLKPLILCDTLPENFPSRRAALKSGFVPAGVITFYRLPFPRWSAVAAGGSWQRGEAHTPELVLPVLSAHQPAG